MRSVWHLASGLNDFFSKNKNNNKNSSKIYIIFRLDYNYFFYGEKRNSLFKEISVENLHRWAKIGFVIPCCKTVKTLKQRKNEMTFVYYIVCLFLPHAQTQHQTLGCVVTLLYTLCSIKQENYVVHTSLIENDKGYWEPYKRM